MGDNVNNATPNNATWSKLIIHQLYKHGVHHFCLAPGSRSTPLAVAVPEEGVPYSTHFDERGLGFYALGLAKGSGRPVAIIVTSGTAVGNLMPAVMEAWHDHVPLIVLTADRPPELRDCSANQTTDQVKIFSSFVHWQVDLPCPFPGGERYLASAMSYGVHLAVRHRGPIHLNCMFREPLYASPESLPNMQATKYLPHHPDVSGTAETLADELSRHERGIIICGDQTDREALSLAEHLQWPLFAEVNSGLRGMASTTAIPYYEHILKSGCGLVPTAVLHCGGRLISKTLMEWCQKLGVQLYAHVDGRPGRLDPYHIATHRIYADAGAVSSALIKRLSSHGDTSWLMEWKTHSSLIGQALREHLDAQDQCTEPGLMHELRGKIDTRHSLFLANSMPIRDANFFLFPNEDMGPVFANRGLSGIDGNIATAAGLAKGTGKPTIAVIGDLAALHDLNSLSLIEKSNVPVLLIVINNRGAGIFSFLPNIAKSPHFEEIFAHRHEWEFEGGAGMFSLPYQGASTREDLNAVLEEFCRNPKSGLLELSTERIANHKLHLEIEASIQSRTTCAVVK